MDKAALVEGYVFGTLNAADMAEAEALRTSDAGFNEEVLTLQALRQAIARNEHDDIRQMVQAFEQQKKQAIVSPIKRPVTWWAAAASISLICALAYWFFPSGDQPEKLFASYYKTMPNIVMPVVRGQQQQDTTVLAFAAYEQKNYQQAEPLFGALYSRTKEPYTLFYQAMSKLAMDDAAGCIRLLESVTWINGRYPLADYSEWYLALANLKINDLAKAKQYLEGAAKPGKPYQNQASALLSKL